MKSFNDHITEAYIDPYATQSVHIAGHQGVLGKWNVWVSYETLKAGTPTQQKLVGKGLDRKAATKLRKKLNSDPKAMKAALGAKAVTEGIHKKAGVDHVMFNDGFAVAEIDTEEKDGSYNVRMYDTDNKKSAVIRKGISRQDAKAVELAINKLIKSFSK